MTDRGGQRRTRFAFAGSGLTLVFIVAAALMLWASQELSRAAAWIPRTVLTGTLILLLVQLANELLGHNAPHPEPDRALARSRTARTLTAIAWLCALVVLGWSAGLAPGSALFCLAWLRWHGGERWPVCLVMAAALGTGLWLVFELLLGVRLHPGFVWPHIG